MQLYQ